MFHFENDMMGERGLTMVTAMVCISPNGFCGMQVILLAILTTLNKQAFIHDRMQNYVNRNVKMLMIVLQFDRAADPEIPNMPAGTGADALS